MKCLDAKPITQAQRFRLMINARGQISFWTAACRQMGWDQADREFRLKTFGEILGRELESASEIGYLKEFDKIKAQLLAWAEPDNFKGQMEMTRQPIIRLQNAILAKAPLAYVAKIAGDRFGTTDLDALTEVQLIQLRDTLADHQVGEHKPETLQRRREKRKEPQPF
jgi:hypothetical protein